MTYLDTQSTLWLYEGKQSKFPKRAKQTIENASNRLISPIVRLELAYLERRIRSNSSADKILTELQARVSLRICELPFLDVIAEAMDISWTEDVFDRIIVAQASVSNSLLITADANIQAHYKHAVWD